MMRLSSIHLRGRELAAALLVLVVMAWMGPLAGLLAGVVVAAMLLALGRSGPGRPRRRSRAPGFAVSGAQVRVVEFAGYVYFDAAKRLLSEVTRGSDGLHFLVLDLRGAIGAERSAAATLARLQRLMGGRGVGVVFTGMGTALQRLLARAGCEFTGPGGYAAEDLRRGLEWCDVQGSSSGGSRELLDRFQRTTGDRWLLPQLLGRCEARELRAGDEVMRTGAGDGSVHFIERGTLSAWQDLGDGDRLLLRTLGPGALVRDSFLQPGADLPVVVTCDTPARVHRLSGEALARLEEEDPFLAAGLERLATGLASERKTPRRGPRGLGIVQALNSGPYLDAAARYARGGHG
jgi:anti-anti-sigma regulatory factor